MREPREHGTLFSAPMVRAVLGTRSLWPKTQTRRLLTRANSVLDYDGGPLARWPDLDFIGRLNPTYPRAFSADAPPSCVGAPEGVASLCVFAPVTPDFGNRDRTVHRIYPRVRPGDRLWVRETYLVDNFEHDESGARKRANTDLALREEFLRDIYYRADGECCDQIAECGCEGRPGWTPSILMPRWASRITLEVTDVRVERVQDISDADISAEGVTAEAVHALCGGSYITEQVNTAFESVVRIDDLSLRDLWRIGWTAINGVESWDANPWVWAYSFRKRRTSGRWSSG